MITDFELGNTRAKANDFARALMSADERHRSGHRAVMGMLVGVTHAGGDHLDENFAFAWWVELDFFDAPAGVDFAQYCGLYLHSVPLWT